MRAVLPPNPGFRHAWATYLGIAALAFLALGWIPDRQEFLQAYLFAFVGWLEISLGCLALLMIYHLTGGKWGDSILPFLDSGAATLPWMALGFLPIALGMDNLYPWMHPERWGEHAAWITHVRPYLNAGFFLGRATGYFAIWSLLVWGLRKWPALSAPGLILYGLTMHFAAFDWTMSLEPEWYSSLYGFLLISSQALPVLGMAILYALAVNARATRLLAPGRLTDLANLLLAFLLVWAYLSFMQFLIIWSGNLPRETSWYIHRLNGGWQWLALILVVFQFACPFVLLLFRRFKMRPKAMALLAAGLFGFHWLHQYWLIAPSFHPGHFHLHAFVFALPLAMGWLWMLAFNRRLARFDLAIPRLGGSKAERLP